MSDIDCPSEAERHDYCIGTLSDADHVAIESHLSDCIECRRAVESQQTEESLFRELKTIFRKDGVTPSPLPFATNDAHSIPGYEIISEAHRGGQGVVFKAIQNATNRTVALKVLLHGQHASEREQTRFEREVNLAAGLQHSNIVTIFESGSVNGMQYCAMQFVEGTPLLDFLHASESASGSSINRVLELFEKICIAVGYAHRRGVIHRDLKPSNILVSEDNQPHILDFGLAKQTLASIPEDELTATGEFLGTLAFASPEQASGNPHLIDTRTDVYSIGMMLYEAIAYSRPYPVSGSLSQILSHITDTEPQRPSSLRSDIPDEVETIILKSLSKDPDRRYQSSDLLAQDIHNFCHDLPIEAKRDSRWYVARKTIKRYRYAFSATAFGLVAIMAALIASITFWIQAVHDRDRASSAETIARQAESAEQDQRVQAEFQSYVANIAAAHLSLQTYDVEDARSRLQHAPVTFRNWEWYELWARSNNSQRTLNGHTSYVEALLIRPDDSLISVSWDKTIRKWTKDGLPQQTIEGPDHAWSIAGTKNGSHFAVSFWNGTIGIWDTDQDEATRWIESPGSPVTDLSFHPTEPVLAFAYGHYDQNSRNGVGIVNYLTGNVVEIREGPESSIVTRFSPDGTLLASNLNTQLILYDSRDYSIAKRIESTAFIDALAFRPDGKRIAVTNKQDIAIFDVETEERVASLRGHLRGINSLDYMSDGSLISTSRDKTVRIWDVSNETASAVLLGHTWAVTSTAITSDGSTLASGSWDQTVRYWDLERIQRRSIIKAHDLKTTSISYNSSGDRIYSGSFDGHVKIWDSTSAKLLHDIRASDSHIQGIAISSDEKLLATASWDHTITLWNLHTREKIRVLTGHSGRVHSVVFTPDSTHLISGSRDNSILVWEVSTGKMVTTLLGHDDHVHSVALSPVGSILASSGHNSLRLWDWKNGVELMSHDRNILQEDFSLAFHPNGQHIATGIESRKLGIFPTSKNQPSPIMCDGHSDEILSVSYHPEGSRLASSSVDGSVKIWETTEYVEVATLNTNGVIATTLRFSPDGNQLAAGLENGTLKIWRINRDPDTKRTTTPPSSSQ